MQQDPHNYGRPADHGQERETVESPAPGSPAMSPQDERTWSSLAHLSILVSLITGFGGLVAAPLIWLFYRERSSRVAFHALQSFWYQAAWAVVLFIGWTVTGILAIVLIGFLLMPFMALLTLVPFAHGIYAAYRVGKGEDYRYPFIADRIDGGRTLTR